jgi:hypothetical protein
VAGPATGNKDPQFIEELLLGLTFVIRRKSFQSSGEHCLRPTAIKESIFTAGGAVSLEKRFCLFSLFFVERQKILSAATLKRPCAVGLVRRKFFTEARRNERNLPFRRSTRA